MVKKILIISFYFPPYAGIEGQRIKSWADNFFQHGLRPTILTRHWSHIPKSWEDYQKEDLTKITIDISEKGRIIRLPYKLLPIYKKVKKYNFSFLTSAYYLFQKIIGNIQIETDAYFSFYGYADKLLEKENFDLILVSAPPFNLVKLGHELAGKYKVPLVIDFRDYYNNEMLRIDYSPSIYERANNFITSFYLKRWLIKAVLITSVSEPICDLLSELSGKKVETIHNGYERDIFLHIKDEKTDEKFVISCVGNLYLRQDINFMIEGFNLFLNDKCPKSVKINFIGLENQISVSDMVKQRLPSAFINVTGRKEREEALTIMKNSQVLYYPGWPKYKGVYSGKIFEYLASKNNILIAPNDNGVLDSLVLNSESGKVAGSPMEMAGVLNIWYGEWETKGHLSYYGKTEKFENFTREAQAEKIIGLIDNILRALPNKDNFH